MKSPDRPRLIRAWTAEENQLLKAYVAEGVSILRAAAALRRSTISVRNQARKLGTPYPTIRDFRKKLSESAARAQEQVR